MITKIYVDLDGVLCDFDLQFSKLNEENLKFSEFIKKYSKTKAWRLIGKSGKKFWSEMPWMPEGKELWSFINKNFEKQNIEILTAGATHDINLVEGKKEWCLRELGDYKVNVVRGVEKQNFANPETILIDDTERNILQFREKGGIGILYKNVNDTLESLYHMYM